MGRGAALEVRDAYPEVQFAMPNVGNVNFCYVDKNHTDQWIGWFKVKHDWKQPADLELIHQSTRDLSVIAGSRPDLTFHLNAPGIGNGGLKWDDVVRVVRVLPDNVLIYTGR